MNDKRLPVKLTARIYILTLAIAWLALFLLVKQNEPLTGVMVFAFWIALQFIFESLAINLKYEVSSSPSFALLFALILLYGPFVAGTIALLASINWQTINKPKQINLWRYIFNSTQLSASTLISGIVYKSLGGLIITKSHSAYTINNFHEQILPLLTAILVFYLVNTSLVVLIISLNERISLNSVWKVSFSWGDLNYLALGFLGIILAQIYYLEPFALILLIVPLAISRQTFSRYMKLEKAYTETIGALIKAIEAKDKYTRGHSERVANLSVKIARQLNLAEDQVEALGRIASLHDIGKIGIPKNILDKPDKLSEEEFLKIKEHPKIGAKILKDVPFLQELIPAVYYHHEKFDGSGYGSGISGSNIPLFARIIAIADSYDAMTSDRAYRKAMSDQKVMDQLLKHSGSQFDAKIVQALMEVLEITLDEKQRNHLHTAPNFS